MNRNKEQLSYKDWMTAIDEYLLEKIYLDQGSLPDWLSRDAYDRGDTVFQGAELCFENSGMGFLYEEALQDEL